MKVCISREVRVGKNVLIFRRKYGAKGGRNKKKGNGTKKEVKRETTNHLQERHARRRGGLYLSTTKGNRRREV